MENLCCSVFRTFSSSHIPALKCKQPKASMLKMRLCSNLILFAFSLFFILCECQSTNAIKLTAFKYRNFVCQASKYCLKCGNVVHFADSVINVMLWAVNDTDCVYNDVHLFETEKEREFERKAKTSFAVLSLSHYHLMRSFCGCFYSFFWAKKFFFSHRLGKLDVDWRTIFENVLCFMLCAIATTKMVASATILFWVNGTLEVSGAITISSFPLELQVKRMKEKVKKRKDEFYKHLKNKRYDPYTHAHGMSANRQFLSGF